MDALPPLPPLLRTIPALHTKVWGGDYLYHTLQKRPPPFAPLSEAESRQLGESWEVADLDEGQSFVSGFGSQEEEVVALHELIRRHGIAITARPMSRYPLLIKVIDAAQDLSVQVHPGADHLPLFPHQPHIAAKDECWLVLATRDEGSVLHGFAPHVTRADFEHALSHNADLTPLLRRHVVSPGDLIHVPPGTVHAICAGVTLLEVQQPSDTTFRVWDYDRPGLDGKPRALHTEQALRVLRFEEQPPLLMPQAPLDHGRAVLIETPHYRLTRHVVTPVRAELLSSELDTSRRATSIFATGGPLTLHTDGAQAPLTLHTGELVLCTSSCQRLVIETSAPQAEFLVIEG